MAYAQPHSQGRCVKEHCYCWFESPPFKFNNLEEYKCEEYCRCQTGRDDSKKECTSWGPQAKDRYSGPTVTTQRELKSNKETRNPDDRYDSHKMKIFVAPFYHQLSGSEREICSEENSSQVEAEPSEVK
jgi:hypothetical protein